MNAEEIKVGCFQMMLVLLLGINYVIVAMSHALLIFHNYTPKFYCQAKDSPYETYGCQETANLSIVANLTSVLPKVPLLATCSGEYRFVTEFAESSVVTEWSLICERRYLSFLGPTVYYIGVLLGAWITGLLADCIGRLPVQAICLYAQGTMAVALYMVQSYPAFLALRGLQGVFVQGLQNSTYILSLELFPARFRTFVALIMQISWSIGLVLLAILSYMIPDWRILQLAVSVPTAITVLYIWIIPESPRWLLAKGKLTEADIAFERIVKYNSCCIRSRPENILLHEACVKNNATPIKPERKSRVTSIELKKAKVDGNQQEEVTSLLNHSEPTERKVIDLAKTIMLLFGKVTVASTISIGYLYTIEIFPTMIRGSCLGLCVVFAKLGSLSMPYSLLSEQHMPLPVPLLTVGILCLIGGLLVLILPETLDTILPDRITSVEDIIDDSSCKRDSINIENDIENNLTDRQILREKLFSEDWVDAGNGILVNFTENQNE
ncbi:hypothetical protein ACFW04_008613 [Cataglyphis niger]